MSEIFIIIGLILLNGVFAMSEIALISARKSSLTTDAKKGSKSAQTALKLANEPDRFLSTIQIGITLIGILTGIYSGNTIAVTFGEMMRDWGIPASYAFTVAQAIIVVIVTYLTLIFGELVPKRIGLSVAESASKIVARPMHVLSVVASPFVWLLSKSTSVMFNFLGIKSAENKVTEEEIKSIIQEGTEGGEVQPVEQDIVQRVFLMGDLKIDSIMTNKKDLVWLDVHATADEVRSIMQEDLFEVYPVADGSLDKVLGVISLKDLVFTLGNPDFSLRKLLTKPMFVYENMSVYKVLEQMKKQGVSRGLVCDEFGACTGIVTMKDILEGLVGTVCEDESDSAYIVKRKDNPGWLVDGQCTIYDFLDYFDCEELYETAEYTTVAGLVINQLEHIPQSGETVVWKMFSFEVVDMDGARVDKLLVQRLDETPETSEECGQADTSCK